MNKKNVYLLVAIVLIVFAIIYLNNSSVKPSDSLVNKTLISSNYSIATDDSLNKIINEKSNKYPSAIELTGIKGFINTDHNITLSEFIGKKVVIIDFWTYSCINCQRTTPYLNSWYDEYEDEGLLIIGVHTPEFDFEKDYNNVLKATQDLGIKYPVVLDSDYQTWRAYNNQYWPRKYIIDIDGFIVYDHIGEGGYDETEKVIQKLLKERSDRLNLNMSISDDMTYPNVSSTDFSSIKSPELYFGFAFSRNQMGNEEGYSPLAVVNYSLVNSRKPNLYYLFGQWFNDADNIESVGNGSSSIFLDYYSRDVNVVAGSDEPTLVSVFVDGVFNNSFIVSDYKLYNAYHGKDYSPHTIELRTSDKGLKVFTYTFG